MKNTFSLFTILLLTFMLSTTAFAQQPYYIGGGIGQSYVEEDNVASGQDFDDEDFAFKLFGGYRFHENFAVEADYLDFGEPDDDILGINLEVDLYALALYGVGILPLTDQFELFAKLGIAYWDAEVDGSFLGISASDDEDGTDLAYGLGASFAFTDQLAARVEYERIDVDDLDNAEMFTVSGEVRF